MPRLQVKTFATPDEVRTLPKGQAAVVNLDEVTVGRSTWNPGWRWSTDLAPIMGTRSCQVHHLGLSVSGVLHVILDDGQGIDIPPDSVFEIPPGHDAWVVGDDPWVTVEWTSARIVGIAPEGPDTGYGYIEAGDRLDVTAPLPVHRVKRFIEKPKRPEAERMIAAGGHYWNAGMFVWRVSDIVAAYREHLPNTAKAIDALADAIGSPRYESVLAEVWEETDRTTIDYGIAEKAANVAVVPADIGWHDVGSWERLAGIVQPGTENWSTDGHVAVAANANYAWAPGKTVAFVGVEGLIVVDTPDALLISSKERSGEVKEVVDRLRREEREDLL